MAHKPSGGKYSGRVPFFDVGAPKSCKSGAPRKILWFLSRRNVESMTNRLSAIAKLPFTIVSGAEAPHVLEEIDVRNPFAGALRIITEVPLSLDNMCRNGRLHVVFGLIIRISAPVVRSAVPENAFGGCPTTARTVGWADWSDSSYAISTRLSFLTIRDLTGLPPSQRKLLHPSFQRVGRPSRCRA
jgi:hypothetical protein